MKLLFDQNLSFRLVERLADIFPGSRHVSQCGLATASDQTVWEYALAEGFVIVTKDEDFDVLSSVSGPPPHVVWIQLGNCTTADIESLLRRSQDDLHDFVGSDLRAILELS